MALLPKKRKSPTKAQKLVFGHDCKLDDNGKVIEQGIGAKGNESLEHYAALARWEPSPENIAKYHAAKAEAETAMPEDVEEVGFDNSPAGIAARSDFDVFTGQGPPRSDAIPRIAGEGFRYETARRRAQTDLDYDVFGD
jgi:hypothetical protein